MRKDNEGMLVQTGIRGEGYDACVVVHAVTLIGVSEGIFHKDVLRFFPVQSRLFIQRNILRWPESLGNASVHWRVVFMLDF